MVLKPFYNKKKISKNSYKDIMRKCVPKVRFSFIPYPHLTNINMGLLRNQYHLSDKCTMFISFQVSHSKNGSINTIKVQKLVNGYVKKYKYMEKRETK